jgi:hypothetical protein
MPFPQRRGQAVVLVAAVVSGLLSGATAQAADTPDWSVSGFDHGGPTAHVRLDQGALTLSVTRGGRTVLEPGSLGIVTEQVDLSKDLRLVRRSSRPVVEHYKTEVGKRTRRTALMREERFSFQGTGGARLDLLVRASRDGVAYRYVLPENRGAILRETSTFQVPATATAWLAKYRRDYENQYLRTTAGGAETAEFEHPALFDVAGDHVLLTESDVDGRHSGARLVHETGTGAFRVKLWDDKVLVDGPVSTQWRAAIVGDLATVANSTLSDDLATPSKVADTSWIKPGKVFWSWLAGGREAGQSLAMQKEYVDYAAAHGWPYVLVDAGWYFDSNWDYDPTWETTSWIPDLIAYAKARGVKIQLWIHFDELDTAAERDSRLALFEKWGVAGLKIDFMDSESQERFRWYDEILAGTAKHKLLVNFHGSTIPHGLQRTWPQVMTMEAVYGGEKSSGLTTSHLTALPFTRNVVGSMDYTPMAWHRPARTTSDAHELALSVIFESGTQDFAGKVADYQARPEAERFLDQVPTVWDETKLLAGVPGESAVFARRSDDRWFVGGGYSGPARQVSVPLEFGSGRWLLDLVKDGLVREQRQVRSGDVLSLDIAANGGFAAIACPWRPGRTTCDEPVRTVPATTVTATPGPTAVTPGQSFEVTGKFTVDGTRSVSDVSLAPRVPAGWRVQGGPAKAGRLRPGQSVAGKWTITAPADFGYFDIPVVASFLANDSGHDGRRIEDEQTTKVHVWRPLPAGWSYLSDRPFASAAGGLGPVERDTTNGQAAAGDGRGIAIRGARFGKGLGTFAASEVTLALDGTCAAFAAEVGVDNEAGLDVARQKVGGTVAFQVLGDGVPLADSGTVGVRTPAKALTADLTGVKVLTLRVTDGGDGNQNDRASWGDVRIRC